MSKESAKTSNDKVVTQKITDAQTDAVIKRAVEREGKFYRPRASRRASALRRAAGA